MSGTLRPVSHQKIDQARDDPTSNCTGLAYVLPNFVICEIKDTRHAPH